MLQMVVDSLRKQGKIYKKMQEIQAGELGVKNRIKIYKATDMKGYFWAIFVINQKSKIFIKDVYKLEEIYLKLTFFCDHNFKHKVIFIDAPLCTKAKEAFVSFGWRLK